MQRGHNKRGVIFFLHANSYSSRLYDDFLKPLYDDYEVWAPDLPGHGESRWNGRIEAWEDLADYFIGYLEHHPPSKPLIGMGHSIGAVIIMLMSIKRPQWFSKVTLLDPVLLPKRILWLLYGLQLTSLTHIVPLARAANRRKRLFPNRQAALEHYTRKKVFSQWENHFLTAYVEHCMHPVTSGEIQLSCAPQLESSIYQSLPLNAWVLPKQLPQPSLFLIGNSSDTVNHRGVKRLKNLKGNHVVKGVDGGHLFPFEKPEESMLQIKEYLSK